VTKQTKYPQIKPPRATSDSNAMQRRSGAGYTLGPHKPKPVPTSAVWITSNQTCERYGGRSLMWLWRKVKTDPAFPKPIYMGRMQYFSVAALDAYDRGLISKRVGA
jgi:predicted DNA-binding transcriptional regulator AlpA